MHSKENLCKALSVGMTIELTFFLAVFRNLRLLTFFNGGVTKIHKQQKH